MPPLKNIIFDLGGVLINLDFGKTSRAFKDIGFHNFDEMYNQFKVDALFEKLEIGSVADTEFYKTLSGSSKEETNPQQLSHAWNSMLLDFRLESLSFLEILKERFNLYLLSNTNSIHQSAFNEILHQQTGRKLDDYFTKTYYSHKVGLRKPEPEIFEYVLSDAGIRAAETLFIDDTIDNITAAAGLGFRTHHFLPGDKIENLQYD